MSVQKWEYRVLYLDAANNALRDVRARPEIYLNELGEKGFELVGMSAPVPALTVLVLQRPKAEEPASRAATGPTTSTMPGPVDHSS